ncbi:CHAD domain-containing protein [Burkholderiaceae bacterium FT117]|uniref:CYTH and CHAD domain-containing protein n=1 Tax=Zeimonas sediminis TaxID=2944268 RepID=UPI002342EB36|nr:CHAD domain-containing protein [Zeimonas sediminis]MCM5569650.1 CHAD domain-containing protein [Zeimonas sediminis]
MNPELEIEVKFLVPAQARKALTAEMARATASLERRTLAAMYLDTPDRRLAKEGIAWRLRREGRRWVQTLKADRGNALERFEHEVIRPDASADASLHAGTEVGDRLLKILAKAEAAGEFAGVRYRTEVRRILRRVRTRGAIVEVALDEGRIRAGGAPDAGSAGGACGTSGTSGTSGTGGTGGDAQEGILRIREVEFELVSGSPLAMLALAERWRKRFGLVLDPRSKAERGDRLAQGMPFPPVRKGLPADYPRDANALDAFGTALDECLAHVLRNAIGLADGDQALRVEHVHQTRVGIRRLRSALRSFRGWVQAPPQALVDELRGFFAALGQSRDADVLDSGVARALAQAGAPPLAAGAGAQGPDPHEVARSAEVQRMLLAWLTWRVGLVEEPVPPDAPAPDSGEGAEAGHSGQGFPRLAERRLRRWHRAICAASERFETLEESDLHALRKRIKRQRYAAEFFQPVLRGSACARYLKQLAVVQNRMGELNDLFVARDRYQALVAQDPAAWFALGWIAARIAELKALALPELRRLARTDPPGR